MYINHQEAKRQELKRIENEIVVDLASRYKGVKSVQFGEYGVSPMGTFDIEVSINHLNMEKYGIGYDMESYSNHPRLSIENATPIAKSGKSDIDEIKVTYNYK